MKDKITYIIITVVAVVVSIAGTFTVAYFFPLRVKEVEKEVKTVTVSETDTIKSAVDKIYNATVVVESYNGTQQTSSGTGFVYKKDDQYGYIITNHHVIEKATKVRIVNVNGESVEAEVLGSDQYADIAVLKIKKDAVLQVAEIGDSTTLELGDTLFTVGTPIDTAYMGTVTKGILSGKDRTISVSVNNSNFMMEVLQTDAAINPGNSGGPLCNINGQVVGINSMKLVEDKIEGMGFAIPIEIAMATVDRLEKGEEIKRPVLGVTLTDVSNSYTLYQNNIYLKEDITEGVAVIDVAKNSVAATAGLQKGDVILEIGDVKIKDNGHFRFVLYKYNINDKVKVKYYRDGKILETEMVLKDAIGD